MKKIISVFAIFIMVGALGCGLWLLNIGGSGSNNTSIVQATPPVQGSGEHAGWWEISTFATLDHAQTRQLMGQTGNRFKITNHIQFPTSNWTPIPLLAVGNVLCGLPQIREVDWDTYEMRDMRTTTGGNRGLFDNMLGCVRNLTFTDVSLPASGNNHGVVAARVQGDTRNQSHTHTIYPKGGTPYTVTRAGALIENVTVQNAAANAPASSKHGDAGLPTQRTISGANQVGSIVGNVIGSPMVSGEHPTRLTLVYALNFATVSANNFAGGLIGEINNANVRVTYSMNGGALTETRENGNTGCAGGLIGMIRGGASVSMSTVYNRSHIMTSQGNGTTAGGLISDMLSGTGGNPTVTIGWAGSTGRVGNNVGNRRMVFGLVPSAPLRIVDVYYDAGCFYDETGLPANIEKQPGALPAGEALPLGRAIEEEIRRISLHEITISSHSASVNGYTIAPTAANANNRVWSGDLYYFTVILEPAYSNAEFAINVRNTANQEIGQADIVHRPSQGRSDAIAQNGLQYTFVTDKVRSNLTIRMATGSPGDFKRNSYTISTTNTDAHNDRLGPPPSNAPFWFTGTTILPTSHTDHEHDAPFTFQIRVGPQYSQGTPTVTSRNLSTNAVSTLNGLRNGDVFTYTIGNITSDTRITVVASQANMYSATVPAGSTELGFLVPSGSGTHNNIPLGGSIQFTVNFLESHTNYQVGSSSGTLTRAGGGAPVTGNNVYTLSNITENTSVSISATRKSYTVSTTTPGKPSVPDSGFMFITNLASANISHGAGYSFSIQVDATHGVAAPSVQIQISGGTITTSVQQNGSVWTYSVTNVTSNLSIAVTTQINRYTVSFARGTNTGTNDVSLPAPLVNIPHTVPPDTAPPVGLSEFEITIAASHSETSIANLLSTSLTVQLQSNTLNANGTRTVRYRIVSSVVTNHTITVIATRNIYNVNIQATGQGISNLTFVPTVSYGDDLQPSPYSFSFDVTESHLLGSFTVTSDGNYEVRHRSGTNIYDVFNLGLGTNVRHIRHDISITFSATIRVYNINFVGGGGSTGFEYGNVGQDVAGHTTRQHGQSLDIVIILEEGRSESHFTVYVYNHTTQQRAAYERIPLFNQNGLIFSLTWDQVISDLTITVGGGGSPGNPTDPETDPNTDMDWNKYSVTLQKTGTGFTAARSQPYVDEGLVLHYESNVYTFVITFASGYGMYPIEPFITVLGGGGIYRAVFDPMNQSGLQANQARYEVRPFNNTTPISPPLIRHNLQINIVASISQHTVKLNPQYLGSPEQGGRYTTPTFTLDSIGDPQDIQINHQQSFTFIVMANPGYHTRNPLISFSDLSGTPILNSAMDFALTRNEHVTTIVINNITFDFEIAVEPLIVQHEVDVPLFGPAAIVRDPNTTSGTTFDQDGVPANGTNFHSFIANGDKLVDHGGNYELTVTVHQHYDMASVLVAALGGTLKDGTGDPQVVSGTRKIIYTVENVTGPLSFEVSVQLATYRVFFYINNQLSNERDGVKVIGASTIQLGDYYEFEMFIDPSYTFPAVNPWAVSSGNAEETMLPAGFEHLSHIVVPFKNLALFGEPAYYYTGGDVHIEIRTYIRTFHFRHNTPTTGVASSSVTLVKEVRIPVGTVLVNGTPVENNDIVYTAGTVLAANTNYIFPQGTEIKFTINPASGYAVTHMSTRTYTVTAPFMDTTVTTLLPYEANQTADMPPFALLNNTEISFNVQVGRPVTYDVAFFEDKHLAQGEETGEVTGTKFIVIGDDAVMHNYNYEFTVEVNTFHSKSGFIIHVTEINTSGNPIRTYPIYHNDDQFLLVPITTLLNGSRAYTFTIPNVQSKLELDIRGVTPNTHTIRMYPAGTGGDPRIGFTVTDESNRNITTIDSAGVFTFTITLDEGYRLTPPTVKTTIANTMTQSGILTHTHPTQNGRVFVYTLAGIMNDTDIDISATQDWYNINLSPGNASTLGWTSQAFSATSVRYGGGFQFYITLEDSHNGFRPVVTIPGIASQNISYGSADFTTGKVRYLIAISGITDHVNITPSAGAVIDVRRNSYQVSFADANDRFTYRYTDNITGEEKLLEGSILDRLHGDPLVFSMTVSPGWTQSIANGTIQVSIIIYTFNHVTGTFNTQTEIITPSISGTRLTFTLTITARVDVLVTGFNRDTYSVHVPPSPHLGYELYHGPLTATYGTSYVFTIRMFDSHNFVGNSVVVRINGVPLAVPAQTDAYDPNTTHYTIGGSHIIGNIEITISVDIKRYDVRAVNVTDPDGLHFIASIPSSIQYGQNLVFSITMSLDLPYHLRDPEVRIGGSQALTPVSSSDNIYSYSVPWGNVLLNNLDPGITPSRLTINVTPRINQFRITMPTGAGYIASHNGQTTATEIVQWVNAEQNGGFTFTITVNGSHNKSTPRVIVANAEGNMQIAHISGLAPSNPVFTFTIPAEFLISNVTIAVLDVWWNTYNVTLPATNDAFIATGPNSIAHSQNPVNPHVYEFTVIMIGSHSLQATPFTVTGGLVPVRVGTTDTFRIHGIVSDIIITINTSVNVYNVKLDAGSGTGFTFENGFTLPTTRTHGQELSFTINLGAKTHHLVPPTWSIGGEPQAFVRDGNTNLYTLTITVTANTDILIQTFINEYTIVFPTGTGFTVTGVGGATGDDQVTHGNGYVFQVEMANSHHAKNPTVSINGTQLVSIRGTDGFTFTFALDSTEVYTLVDNDGFLWISVEAEENVYTITLTPPVGEVGWTIGSEMTNQVPHGEDGGDYRFWVQLGAAQHTLDVAPIVALTDVYGNAISQNAVQFGDPTITGRYFFDITNITRDITVMVSLTTIFTVEFLAPESTPAFSQSILGTAGQHRPRPLAFGETIRRPGYDLIEWVARDSSGIVIIRLDHDWATFTMPAHNLTFFAVWSESVYTLVSTASPLAITYQNNQDTVFIGQNKTIWVPDFADGIISWEALNPETGVFERFTSSTVRTINLIDNLTPAFFARYASYESGNVITIQARHIAGTTHTITARITEGTFGEVELKYLTSASERILTSPVNTEIIAAGEVVQFNFTPDNAYFKAQVSKLESGVWTEWEDATNLVYNTAGEFRVRFVSREFTVNFTFVDSDNEELPNGIIEGIQPQYNFQLDSRTGIFTLIVSVDNLNALAALGYSFDVYQITSGEGYLITNLQQDARFFHKDGFITFIIDADFLNDFLDGTIDITAHFVPMRAVGVEFLTVASSFEVYTVAFDEENDEDILLKAPGNATNSFPVGTEFAIAVKPNGHFMPEIDHPAMNRSAETRDGIYYFYFIVPYSHDVWDPEIGGSGDWVTKTDLLVQIGFTQTVYGITVERRVGTETHSTEALQETIIETVITIINGEEVEEEVERIRNATAVASAAFPEVNFADSQPESIGLWGSTYYFTGWHFQTIDGRVIPAIVDTHVDEFGNISAFLVSDTFLETYVGPAGSTTTITLIAMYGEKASLRVNIANGLGVAGAKVIITNSESITETITVFANHLFEVAVGDEVRIEPVYDSLVFSLNVTGTTEFTVVGPSIVSLSYSAKSHDFLFSATSKSKNGKLDVQINGQTITSPNTFTIGDIVTFSFNTGPFHNLNKLYISNGTTRIAIKNGQPIVIDSAWLESWKVNGELNLDFKVDAKTGLKPIVVICLILTAILIPLLGFLVFLHIKKKKQAKGGL